MSGLWNESLVHDNSPSRNEYSDLPVPNMSRLPWSTQITNPMQVIEFKAVGHAEASTASPQLHTKRKPPLESVPVPRKRMLTEESMAAHLSNLHISSSPQHTLRDECMASDDSLHSYTINMATWDFEQKLRNAQKITICNEILELERDNLLPEILMNRIEKPCSALVLWQPPRSLIGDNHNPENRKNSQDDTDEMET